MAKADLHIHTLASDGHMSPEDVVRQAIRHKLDIIAVTDHDTLKGYRKARKVAEETEKIRLLPGIEITADVDGRECHLLAYCFNPDHQAMLKLTHAHYHSRLKRAKWIIGQLSQKGLDIDIEEVKAEARGGNIGRPHIAAVLLDKGYVGTLKEAFVRFISDQRLGTIYNEYFSHHEVIDTIKKAGGAAVIAHPGRLYTNEELEQLVEAGVDGIEVIHPSHNYRIQQRIQKFAEHHQLLITGGSDFHGSAGKYQKYFGIATINVKHVLRLVKLTDQRKKMTV